MMNIKEIRDNSEIKKLYVVGYNIEKNKYMKKNMEYYDDIMIVNNIVINIECNSQSCNDRIVECIKNDNYNFSGIIGFLVK